MFTVALIGADGAGKSTQRGRGENERRTGVRASPSQGRPRPFVMRGNK